MIMNQLEFLTSGFVPLLKDLPANAKGNWGKMNAQQMAEHVSRFFKVSNGKIIMACISPPEHLPKLKEFLLSDKQFRENTKAPIDVVPEEPVALTHDSMAAALEELQGEVNDFVKYFEQHPGEKTTHPVFGELNFDEWVRLHHKHVSHHLRQFGIG